LPILQSPRSLSNTLQTGKTPLNLTMEFDRVTRRIKTAAGPREEFKTDLGFEIPDESTYCWLANPHQFACCGVAAGLKDEAECLNLPMMNAQVVPITGYLTK
jgi:hypothetical protein